MAVSWQEPAGVLLERAEAGWGGLWSLTLCAGAAALSLSAVVSPEAELRLLEVAADLNAALLQVEAVHPEVLTDAVAVDLGPVVDTRFVAVAVAATLIDEATRRAMALTHTLGLGMGELLALARVQPLLASARAGVLVGVSP